MRDLKYMYFYRLEKKPKSEVEFYCEFSFLSPYNPFFCKTSFSLLTFDHQFIIYLIVLNPSLLKEKPTG